MKNFQTQTMRLVCAGGRKINTKEVLCATLAAVVRTTRAAALVPPIPSAHSLTISCLVCGIIK